MISFNNSINELIAVLKWKRSRISVSTFKMVRWINRSNLMIFSWSSSAWLFSWHWIISTTVLQTRLRKRCAPSTPRSDHSISNSGGPAKRMKMRTVSAPYFCMISRGLTTFSFDFDILTPPLVTITWANKLMKGSEKLIIPKSFKTFTKKRE